ncbi:MAG TPA: ABC transporter permease subunit [Pyrinomonadaceae bacterium]|nr:ABC transporter permease subunit [Pyrinomonadaceae bacterium]
MAVYEQTYKRYDGKLTPEWSRFLIIPRHAYESIFSSKLLTAFFVICFLPLLLEAILIYLHHNYTALTIMQATVKDLIPIDNTFFRFWTYFEGFFAFFLALLLGPPLVARDLRNNALPLYLCRPFSRTEYVMGKMSVILILLSTITWIPQLLLFLFQSYLEGFAWFKANLWIASAIIIANFVWIVLLALLTQTISALVKWRVVASGVLLGLFIIPSAFAEIINQLFQTRWGSLLSLGALMKSVTDGLFGLFDRVTGTIAIRDFDGDIVREIALIEPPLWCSWAMLFLVCAICLAVLSWKVKAYEVVK